MRVFFNIICSNKNKANVKRKIEYFVCNHCKKLISSKDCTYWKNKKCSQLFVEVMMKKYTLEELTECLGIFYTSEQQLTFDECECSLEIALYTPIPEILISDKVFFTLFAQKDTY